MSAIHSLRRSAAKLLLITRASNVILRKATAVALLVGLLIPMWLAKPVMMVKAAPRASVESPQPVSQPTPFIVPATERQPTVSAILAAGIGTRVAQLLEPEHLAPGLALPNSSLWDRFVGTAMSVATLGVVKGLSKKPARKGADESSETIVAVPTTPSIAYDFDGDGKADTGRWHSVGNEFKVRKADGSGNLTYSLGSSSAVAAPGDFDGDGKTDAGVFSSGTWTYKTSTGGTAQTISLGSGSSGDIPMAADFDGDGKTDAGVWYVVGWQGYFKWKRSSDGVTVTTAWGSPGDIPITGDWDGDGKADFAIYRPSSGDWWTNQSTNGVNVYNWGNSTDIPIQGDFDGDGKSDLTIYRPSDGTWWVKTSGSGFSTGYNSSWGEWLDQPVPADYDGDGKTDLAVWRPSDNNFYIVYSGGSPANDGWTLGVQGDEAVTSAYIKQVSGTATPDDMSEARLKPINSTGSTDYYSQNFHWGTNLVSLPGRAGLDLNLGLSYNSLMWQKVGSAVYYDRDEATSQMPAGFRLAFPTIEPVYYNAATSKWSYLLIGSDGSRTDFREISASNVYESADSSHAQITANGASSPNDPVEGLTLTLRTTDGTQYTYSWVQEAYKVTQIKDRNGNYISVNYDGRGFLDTMTDTLGRVVTVNYNSDLWPSTITQTWKGTNGSGSTTTHTWATFTYTTKTVSTSFDSSLLVVGPPNSESITVLNKVTYADGSSTKFDYNGYLQVDKVSNIGADSTSHILNSVEPNLASPGTVTDCPRFTSTNVTTENFNSGSAVTYTNSAPASSSFSGPGGTETTSVVNVAMTGDPDNHYARIHYGPAGSYKEGLNLATQDCTDTSSTHACTTQVRWTWNSLTQDNTSATYITNPRVTESQVGDGTNTKRTTIDYGSNGYGLPETVKVYDIDQTTVLKTQTTAYNLSSNYTNLRIIGLPSESKLYTGGTISDTYLASKVTYAYDESGYAGTGQSVSPTQHDGTNFGTGLTYRGNATSAIRWDATAPTTSGSAVSSSVVYNTAGLPISSTDPRGRTNTVSYNDSWNDGTSRSTYAFPTSVTDPNGNSATMKYRFDTGAYVEGASPAPAGQTYGKTTKDTYDDSTGALTQNSTYVNTTLKYYQRYEYPTNDIEKKSYATIVDTAGSTSGPDSADEVLTDTWTDGAGRVRETATEHPGSTGGYAAVLTDYDILGRTYRQSVPTEASISGSTYTAAGDDATRGFIYNYSYYDWKGRPTRTVPSDSNGSDGKDTLITYGGCGCAGGQITTIKGPITDAFDVSGTEQTTKRRVQVAYADSLGRAYKTETHDLDDPTGTPYSTVKTTFNVLDKPTLIRKYAGSDSSSTYQDTTMSYDGHGRLAQSHKPEQRDYPTGTTLKYTTYTYNADDTVATQTDGRGVVTTYSYGHVDDTGSSEYRNMLTKVAYTVPGGSGITDPSDIVLTYDAAGDRTAMTDGLGSVAYAYNSLSQMTSETRSFTDTLADAPSLGNSFQMQYSYTLSGSLKSYTDPYGQEIDYAHDKAGRLSAITGSSFASVTSYANNPTYRAWGDLKHLEYGNGAEINLTHDDQLRPSTFELKKSTTSIIKKDYDYYQSGELKKVTDDVASWYDNLFKYDFNARTTAARSTTEASGTTETTLSHLPFHQDFTYDNFSHLTDTSGTRWTDHESFGYPYMNNIKYQTNTSSYYPHDNDGRDTTAYQYDGAGANTYMQGSNDDETYRYFDGNGTEGKRAYRYYDFDANAWSTLTNAYFITSIPLGGAVVTEADGTGKKTQTNVLDGNSVLARQQQWVASGTTHTSIVWEHRDPSDTELSFTDPSGTVTGAQDNTLPSHFDGLGRMTGSGFTFVYPPPKDRHVSIFETYPPELGSGQCTVVVDGIEDSCDHVSSEATVQCPNNYCGPIHHERDLNGDGKVDSYWDLFYAFNDGFSGYGPATGGSYAGEGRFVVPTKGDRPPTLTSFDKGEIPPHTAGPSTGSDPEADDRLLSDSDPDHFLPSNYDKAIYVAQGVLARKLVNGAISEDCQKMVFDKLKAKHADFDQTEFAGFINQGVGAYDGTTSTTPISGGITSPQAAQNEPWKGSKTVRDFFDKTPGLQALTSIMTGASETVYFRPGTAIDLSSNGDNAGNESLLFHEGLHGYGGLKGGINYDDTDLQDAFGITVDRNNTTNISKYIKDHCF